MPPTRQKTTAKKATRKKTAAKKTSAKTTGAKKPTAKKYGPKASEMVELEMREMNEGTLRSGNGAKVTSRKQAIAIGLSKARRAGGKVPKKR